LLGCKPCLLAPPIAAAADGLSSGLRQSTAIPGPDPLKAVRPIHLPMSQVSIDHLRHLIRTLNYVVSTHAADELEDDQLSILDLENVVLTGQIVERQRDRSTREAKYVIQGASLSGAAAEVVAKLGHTGKLVVITVYLV